MDKKVIKTAIDSTILHNFTSSTESTISAETGNKAVSTVLDSTNNHKNSSSTKSISTDPPLDDSTNAAKLLFEAAGEEMKRAKHLEKLICDSV